LIKRISKDLNRDFWINMMPAKTIYTAEPLKFSLRIWDEMVVLLTFGVLVIGAIGIGTRSIGAIFVGLFVLFIVILFGCISQYKYRFIQATSIVEEDGEFVFELLYKDELYAHVIKKSNISTKLDTVAGEKAAVYKLAVFDREKEVFVLYSGSGIMKEADLKKIKAGLDS